LPELVSPLAPIVLELELVSVEAVLLLEGVEDDELDALVSVLGVLGDAAVEPLLLDGVVLLLPGVAAVLPEPVEPLLPVVAPAPGLVPVEPEVVPELPDVCAMEMPPMTNAAAAATVVRVFLMVIML
jgi:hypothetical protein